MSKTKKPAEDNSKASAVTNSIADELDEILDHIPERMVKLYQAYLLEENPTVPDPREMKKALKTALREAKTALKSLIAEAEREAKLSSLKAARQSYINSELLFFPWIEGEIATLTKEQEK